MHRPASSSSIYASADRPADAALSWLTARFDEQAACHDPAALTPAQRAELAELLGSTWWREIFDSDREADAEDPGTLLLRALPPAVRAASALPQGGLVLALYLRNLVNDAWAMAWDHTLLVTAITTACTAAEALPHDPDGIDELGWALLRFMLSEFRVETALLTGRLGVVSSTAADAVAEMEPLVAAIGVRPTGPGRDDLLREAANELTYYRAVRDCATVGLRMLRGDRHDTGADLDRIRSEVGAASFNQMDASELRGHLAAVDRIESVRDRAWLHVDAGRVRIVYPFGIRLDWREDPAEVIAALRAEAQGRLREGRPIGALPIVATRGRLDLSDTWQGTDSFGRGYRGATIRLGSIVLENTGDRTPLEVVETRIQFSQLGNHALVFEIDLDDAPAYRVAEALHLATPVFGNLTEIAEVARMRVPSGATVTGLSEIVAGLFTGIRGMLDAVPGTVSGSRLSSRDGSFGIMVTVLEASAVGPHGREPLRDARALVDLWGVQSLLHPLPSGVASVADWVLQDVDGIEPRSLLHLNGELLAANSNMTLLASFASPDFAVNEMESYIEFAHSLHGMYQGWQDSVRYFAERTARLLRSVEGVLSEADRLDEQGEIALSEHRAAAIADLDRLVREIERTELSLQSFVQSNEAVMLFIESPDIVASPPLRQDLDTILDSNGYPRLRDGFTRALRDVLGTRMQPLLAVVHHRMEQAYQAETERARDATERARQSAERRNARVFEVLGVVATVVGFSGLVQILQAGSPEWDSGVAWWLVVGILGLAVVVAFAVSRVVRHDGDDEERTSPGGTR